MDPRDAEIQRLRQIVQDQQAQLREVAPLREKYPILRQRVASLLREFAEAYHPGMTAALEHARIVIKPAGPDGPERTVSVRAFREASLAVFEAPEDSFWVRVTPEQVQAHDARPVEPPAPVVGPLINPLDMSTTLAPLMVWADGSGHSSGENEAGAGVVVVDGPNRIERGVPLGKGTNNFAELSAIKVALEILRDELAVIARPIIVHTDSEYAIGMLSRNWKAQKNVELVEEIKGLLTYFAEVKFRHVHGHTGDVHNEMADRLAAAAVATGKVVPSHAEGMEALAPVKRAAKLIGPKKGKPPPSLEPLVTFDARMAAIAKKCPQVRVVYLGREASRWVYLFCSYTADPTTQAFLAGELFELQREYPRTGSPVGWGWMHAFEPKDPEMWDVLWQRE